MEQLPAEFTLLKDIVDRISVGVFVVNKQNELVLWNGYMENYSQTKAEDVVGKNIFDSFPDLPKNWLEQKIHNVFVIKNFSFTSWEHRPYLFKFLHNRPITGGIDYMRQNCTFLPVKGDSGDIEYVCVTLFDVTDTSIYESMLKNAVRSLAEASNRDGLTNVYNRRFLETSMAKEFSRIKRYGGTLTFIIVDLDHFKAVNDNHGHLAGDEILKVAAKRLAEGLRTADTLSRYGGEEFAVMLPETPIDGAAILAQRLCDNLAATPVQFGDKSLTVSASLGVAEFQPDMESYEVMIARADDMLYRSKENGRNQVTVYYPDKELATENSEQGNEAVIDGKVIEKQEENLAANIIEPVIETTQKQEDITPTAPEETGEAKEQEETIPAAIAEEEIPNTVETEAEISTDTENDGDSMEHTELAAEEDITPIAEENTQQTPIVDATEIEETPVEETIEVVTSEAILEENLENSNSPSPEIETNNNTATEVIDQALESSSETEPEIKSDAEPAPQAINDEDPVVVTNTSIAAEETDETTEDQDVALKEVAIEETDENAEANTTSTIVELNAEQETNNDALETDEIQNNTEEPVAETTADEDADEKTIYITIGSK